MPPRDGASVASQKRQSGRAACGSLAGFPRSAAAGCRGAAISHGLRLRAARCLSFCATRRKDLFYQLVIIPLWVSYLVRGYAWKTILGSDGVLNGFLQYLHITSHPVEFFLYSPFAVILTLTHIYTPFTFLPIFASLEQVEVDHLPVVAGKK